MRTFTLTMAAAGAVLAAASPATAQAYSAPNYGYAQAAAFAQNNWLFNFRDQRYARMMQNRVQRIRHDIRQMGAMRILSRSEVRDLDREAVAVEQRIWRYSRNGVSMNDARKIDNRVRRLEDRVMREARDFNRRPGVRRYNPYDYNQYYDNYRGDRRRDRDRDGRDDRYEDDRGRDRD